MNFPSILNIADPASYAVSTTQLGNGLPQLPLGGFSEQNEVLEKMNQAAEKKLFHLFFEMGKNMGKTIRTLQAEKPQLECVNRTLENEITLLKSLHSAELNAVVDSHTAKIKMITEKIKYIGEKCALYKKKFEGQGHHFSLDISLFTTLQKNISLVRFEDIRQYPDCSNSKNTMRLEEKTIMPSLSNALIQMQLEPQMDSLMEKPMKEYKLLEKEVAPLREANFALLNKKEMLIDFHGKYLPQIHREKVEPQLKKILELVRSTYDNVEWDKIAQAKTEIHQNTLNKKVKKIQEGLKGIISTLETHHPMEKIL